MMGMEARHVCALDVLHAVIQKKRFRGREIMPRTNMQERLRIWLFHAQIMTVVHLLKSTPKRI